MVRTPFHGRCGAGAPDNSALRRGRACQQCRECCCPQVELRTALELGKVVAVPQGTLTYGPCRPTQARDVTRVSTRKPLLALVRPRLSTTR